MSFPVLLYSSSSPSNKVDKEIDLVATATGVLKDETSIIDPIIEIRSDLSLAMVSTINFAYIEAFNRYYFVTNIVSTTNGLWEIHMHVDVLMTYKAQIREQDAVVARQSEQYNVFLNDGWFMAYQNSRIQTKYFSNGSPFEAQEYVLIVAGS